MSTDRYEDPLPPDEAAEVAAEHEAAFPGHMMAVVHCDVCMVLLGYLCSHGCGRLATNTHGAEGCPA